MQLKDKKTTSPIIVLQEFQRVVTPEQEIPSLGEYNYAVCPQGVGVTLIDPPQVNSTGRSANTAMRMVRGGAPMEQYRLPFMVLYGANFEGHIFDCINVVNTCCTNMLGYVHGYELVAPVPPENHPAWEPVKFEHNHISGRGAFISMNSGDLITKADIVIIDARDMRDPRWQEQAPPSMPRAQDPRRMLPRCRCNVIIDASKL